MGSPFRKINSTLVSFIYFLGIFKVMLRVFTESCDMISTTVSFSVKSEKILYFAKNM
jgi:hypothetical protein